MAFLHIQKDHMDWNLWQLILCLKIKKIYHLIPSITRKQTSKNPLLWEWPPSVNTRSLSASSEIRLTLTLYMCVHIYISTHTLIYTYIKSIYVHIYTHTYWYACVCIYIYACIYGAGEMHRQKFQHKGDDRHPVLSLYSIRYTAKQHYPHGIANGCYWTIKALR